MCRATSPLHALSPGQPHTRLVFSLPSALAQLLPSGQGPPGHTPSRTLDPPYPVLPHLFLKDIIAF